MKTIGIPVAVYDVQCEIATGRPFAMAERTVLQSIAAGHDEFESLLQDLQLHPRMLTECLTVLFEAGIIEFRDSGTAFAITLTGQQALANSEFIPSTLSCVRKPFKVVVERITGLAEVGRNVTFERTDELRGRKIPIMQPSAIDPTPGRSTIRRLIERGLGSGSWVRSIAAPESIFQYSSCVQVDVVDGRLEGLKSADWVWGLTQALRERGLELSEPAPVEPTRWITASASCIRSVSGAAAHALELDRALDGAQSYVFVHSAFLSGLRAKELVPGFTRALRRGVDIIITRGGVEEASDADEAGVATLKKLWYDERTAKGRFFFEQYPTGSHAKLLIVDGTEAFIGSFNWLSARPDSRRPELSVGIGNIPFVSRVCDVAADLFRVGDSLWPAQLLRSCMDDTAAEESNGHQLRLVLDADNRECLFRYLEQAENGLTIASDRVSSVQDPLLKEKLLRAARRLAEKSKLRLQYGTVSDHTSPMLEGLVEAGAVIISDRLNHIKGMVSDDHRALVTSFNLLSFSGHSRRRSSGFEIGIEIRALDRAPAMFRSLLPPLYD